jgi:hypothetical protein
MATSAARPDRRGDLGHRNEVASVEHRRSREQQNGSPLAADFGQPKLAATLPFPYSVSDPDGSHRE